jgi:hypothetical protein
LAEVCGKAGQIQEGLQALDEAFALVERNEERVWEAELYRRKGELTLQQLSIASTPSSVIEFRKKKGTLHYRVHGKSEA